MSLASGSRLGPYEIVAAIGAGVDVYFGGEPGSCGSNLSSLNSLPTHSKYDTPNGASSPPAWP